MVLITETGAKQVTRIDPATGSVTAVDVGITLPNGIALSNDGGTLVVSDYGGEHAWMFRVHVDGTLDAKMPSMTLRLPIDPKGEFRFHEPPPYVSASKGDGLAVDRKGRYYITSELGVQIFDPTGRLCGVLPKPRKDQPLTTCILGGSDHNTLYIANGTTIYSRRLTVD
jgi:enterochelin esterase family protein